MIMVIMIMMMMMMMINASNNNNDNTINTNDYNVYTIITTIIIIIIVIVIVIIIIIIIIISSLRPSRVRRSPFLRLRLLDIRAWFALRGSAQLGIPRRDVRGPPSLFSGGVRPLRCKNLLGSNLQICGFFPYELGIRPSCILRSRTFGLNSKNSTFGTANLYRPPPPPPTPEGVPYRSNSGTLAVLAIASRRLLRLRSLSPYSTSNSSIVRRLQKRPNLRQAPCSPFCRNSFSLSILLHYIILYYITLYYIMLSYGTVYYITV